MYIVHGIVLFTKCLCTDIFYFFLGEGVYTSIDSWTRAAEIASILIQKR